jgi:hypothetical protein
LIHTQLPISSRPITLFQVASTAHGERLQREELALHEVLEVALLRGMVVFDGDLMVT